LNANKDALNGKITTLQGSWLLMGRAAWLVLMALTLAVFVASLPVYFAQAQTICRAVICPAWQITLAGAETIQRLGFSLHSQAVFQTSLAVLIELVSFAVGAIIFWRRSSESIALVVALFLIVFVSDLNNNLEALTTIHPAWVLPVLIVQFVWWSSTVLVFYLFPDGRFVPRWTRWLTLGLVMVNFLTTFFLVSAANEAVQPESLCLWLNPEPEAKALLPMGNQSKG
jgi:hypothetical protein